MAEQDLILGIRRSGPITFEMNFGGPDPSKFLDKVSREIIYHVQKDTVSLK